MRSNSHVQSATTVHPDVRVGMPWTLTTLFS
jgi:hypothetical protein